MIIILGLSVAFFISLALWLINRDSGELFI